MLYQLSYSCKYYVGVDGLEPPMSETADLQSAAIATMRYPHRCSIILVSYGIEYPVYFIVTVQAQDSVVSVPLYGASRRTRTADRLITNQLLYQLSYRGGENKLPM